MKRITFSRKQILRAIHAACVALFFAACAGRAGAAPSHSVEFTVNGSTVTVLGTANNTTSAYFSDPAANAYAFTIQSGANLGNTTNAGGSNNLISFDNGSVNNAGSLSSSGYTITINSVTATSTVTNSNLITSTGGFAVVIYGNGIVNNNDGATISTTSASLASAVKIFGNGTVNNSGTISGYYDGVHIVGNGTVTNTATGSISTSGNYNGVEIDGDGTVINAGSISGNASGVYIHGAGGASSVTNSGSISGNTTSSGYTAGVEFLTQKGSSPSSFTLVNSAGGTITASAQYGGGGVIAFGVLAEDDNGNISITNAAGGQISGTGTSSGDYDGLAYGIYAASNGSGNVTITNGGAVSATATVSANYRSQAYGISAFSEAGTILITNTATGVVTGTASNYNAFAYGIGASGFGSTVKVINDGLATGTATASGSYSGTGYGISATSSPFGSASIYVTNGGTATGSGTTTGAGYTGTGTGISASSYSGNVTVTNTGTASGYGISHYSGGTGVGYGISASSNFGNVNVTNSGYVLGSGTALFNSTSSYAQGYGISASSVYGTSTIVNKGNAVGTGSAYYSGTGYGIYSSNSQSGNISITNNGQATGEGTATDSGGDPTGTGYGIYASGNSGYISIVNNGSATGTGTATVGGGMAAGSGDGIAAKTNSGSISILNTGTATGTGSGFYSGTGSGLYTLSNSGAISIQNKGTATGNASCDASAAFAYGIYAISTTTSPVTITNTGTATGSATTGNAGNYYSTSPAFGAGILVGSSTTSGNIVIANSGTASGFGTVNGSGSGYGYGINIHSTSGSVTIINGGMVEGTGSSYAGAGVGYGIAIQPVSGAVSITNAISGVIEGSGFATSGFAGTGSSYGITLFKGGTGPATINNSGTISAYNGIGIFAHGYSAPITINAIGGAITTTASGAYSGAYDAVLLGANETNTVNIVGQSNITGLIDGGSGGDNTLSLHLAGMTPAQKAALQAAVLASAGGGASGPVFAGGVTYSWVDFENVAGSFVSLEQSVDPGLEALAIRIDNLTAPLPVAYGPFYVAAADNPEAAMNELVGREINQGLDTLGVNIGTTFNSNLDEHLDNLLTGGQLGGIDLGGMHVSEAGGMYAMADTTSQLESIIHTTGSSVFGGTEMSTDTKAMIATPPPPAWGLWASGNVTLGDESSANTLSGFHSTLGSPTLGLDYRVCPNLVLGIVGSYTTGAANFDDGSNIGLNTELLALYGTWRSGNWHIDGIAGGGLSQFNDTRTTFSGLTANSTPRGYDILTDWTAGYDFHLGDRWNITPEVGVQYTHLGIDSFSETGAGVFDLAEGSQDIDSLRSHVGFRIDKAYNVGPDLTFTPELRALWYHEFLDDSRGVSTSLPGAPALGSFSVNTFSPQRDFALVGVGLNTAFTGYKGVPVGLFLNYDAQVGQSDYIANSVNAGIRIDF